MLDEIFPNSKRLLTLIMPAAFLPKFPVASSALLKYVKVAKSPSAPPSLSASEMK